MLHTLENNSTASLSILKFCKIAFVIAESENGLKQYHFDTGAWGCNEMATIQAPLLRNIFIRAN